MLVIENSDTVLAEYSCAKNGEYSVKSQNGYSITLKIENGKVSVIESDCPNGYCRQSGAVSRAGEVIVCAPAHVKLKVIASVEGGEFDAVIG